MHRLDAHIEASLGAALPEPLVSRVAYERIRRVAAMIPAVATDFFGFECRLGEATGRTDFLLCLKPDVGGRAVLAGTHPEADFPAPVFEIDVWRRLRRLARGWVDPVSPLYEPVRNVWLEFDLGSEPEAVPVPCVFFGTDRLSGELLGGKGAVATNAAWMIDTALPILRGTALEPPLRGALVQALGALPAGARVFQVGLMLARPGDAIRLCIRELGGSALEYLRAAGWCGEEAVLAAALAESEGVDRIALDIDVVPGGVHPRIGVECVFDATLVGRRRLGAFLGRLVDVGACLPDNRDALLTWPRLLHSNGREDDWPADLLARANGMPTRTVSAFWRWIYHIKLVHDHNGLPEAKAYLAVKQDWLDGPRVRGILEARRQAVLEDVLASMLAGF